MKLFLFPAFTVQFGIANFTLVEFKASVYFNKLLVRPSNSKSL